MEIKLQELTGNWNVGVALNLHTTSSTKTIDSYGNEKWDTVRPEIGEELYRLKYYNEANSIKKGRVNKIADAFNTLIGQLKIAISKKLNNKFNIDYIIPVPPSKSREFKLVEELAKKVSELAKIPLDLTTLKKVKSTLELKKIDNIKEKAKILDGAFDIKKGAFKNKNVLLLDDVYSSGSTVKEITKTLKEKGEAKKVIVLTVTKTRSKR